MLGVALTFYGNISVTGFDFFGYYHETSVVYMVYTGRKGNKIVPEFCCDTGVVNGKLFDVIVEVIKLSFRIRLEKFVKLKNL